VTRLPDQVSRDVVVIGGCGHVGLPLALAFADRGARVGIYDVSEAAVRQLAELIWRKVKGASVPLRLVHDDPYPGDVQRRVPDTEKAKKMLGFEATTTLDQMLDEVIPWIDAAIKAGTI